MATLDDLQRCAGFDWDDGNSGKNWHRHTVSDAEAEEIFFNDPLVAAVGTPRSQSEPRYFVLGRTDSGRLLFVAFTIRGQLIRVISARDMTRKEARRYLA
jgi:uncharacterized DUF497 family protein